MKKHLSLMAFAMMAVFSLTFASCSSDDDNKGSSSELVGTWDVVKTTYYYDGLGSNTEDGNGAYWVFTENKLTVYDPEDLMNGKSVDYIYDSNSKELKVAGFPIYKITELTSSTLVLRADIIKGYQITNFKKR